MSDDTREHLVGGSSTDAEATIEDYFSENRVFPPSEEFRPPGGGWPMTVSTGRAFDRRAWSSGPSRPGRSTGSQPWDSVLEWDLPFARWFDGGTLNVSYNCLDRHVAAGRGDKVAFHWEGEPGDTRTLTYGQLLTDVSVLRQRAAGVWGVGRGDRVAIYMPMIPELTVAMLACTRIGAVHSVVFGGFSSDALRDRILDAQARVVVTADGGWRRGVPVASEGQCGRGRVRHTPALDHVVVARRISGGRRPGADHGPGRDHWWHDLLSGDDGAAGSAVGPVRTGAHGRRGPAVSSSTPRAPPRHPQGDHALDRRLPHPGGLHPPGGLRPPPRTGRLLVCRRHRVGHRSQLHRVRPAGQRRHLRCCTREPPTSPTGTGGGRSSTGTG